jgi:hypothetical protein
MRMLLSACLLLFSSGLSAQNIVVFAIGDTLAAAIRITEYP